MKKRIEKAEEEEKRYSFRPQLVSYPSKSAKRDTSQDVKDRLLEWNKEKNKRLEAKVMEKIHTEVAMSQEMDLPTRKRHDRKEGADETHDSISTYERLYQDSSHKKIRKEMLEKKVLKDMGASFTPKTNLNRNNSARKLLKENANNSGFMSPGTLNFSREGI